MILEEYIKTLIYITKYHLKDTRKTEQVLTRRQQPENMKTQQLKPSYSYLTHYPKHRPRKQTGSTDPVL